jgi:hypothetical protein
VLTRPHLVTSVDFSGGESVGGLGAGGGGEGGEGGGAGGEEGGCPGIQLMATEAGMMNGVLFYFELQLDQHAVLSGAPEGLAGLENGGDVSNSPARRSGRKDQAEGQEKEGGKGGRCGEQGQQLLFRSSSRGQALQYLDHVLPVLPGQAVPLLAHLSGSAHSSPSATSQFAGGGAGGGGPGALRFSLHEGMGLPVPKAPWLVSVVGSGLKRKNAGKRSGQKKEGGLEID